jgi:hypothetical protein
MAIDHTDKSKKTIVDMVMKIGIYKVTMDIM